RGLLDLRADQQPDLVEELALGARIQRRGQPQQHDHQWCQRQQGVERQRSRQREDVVGSKALDELARPALLKPCAQLMDALAAVAHPVGGRWLRHRRGYALRRCFTSFDTRPMSAWPASLGFSAPISLPISAGPAAPISAMAASMAALIAASSSFSGT